MTEGTSFWDNVSGDFEKHPTLNADLKKVGDKKTVKALDDGKEVKAATLKKANETAGRKDIVAKDSIVVTVQDGEEKRALWLGATNFTNLNELKEIRDANGGTLEGAEFTVERVSEGDVTKAALQITPAKA